MHSHCYATSTTNHLRTFATSHTKPLYTLNIPLSPWPLGTTFLFSMSMNLTTRGTLTEFRTFYPKIKTPWHIEYLKEFEKQQVQEGLFDLPLIQVIDPHVRGILSVPGKRSTLTCKSEGHQKESEQTGIAVSPPPYNWILPNPLFYYTFP